jgi:hypothetical protein
MIKNKQAVFAVVHKEPSSPAPILMISSVSLRADSSPPLQKTIELYEAHNPGDSQGTFMLFYQPFRLVLPTY